MSKESFALNNEGREQLSKISKASPPSEPIGADLAKTKLLAFTLSLHRDNYVWAAAAISRFLLGECNSLDQAFGLKSTRRGKPRNMETLTLDANVILARWDGKSWMEIADETGMDESTARKLFAAVQSILSEEEDTAQGKTAFHQRAMYALCELIRRKEPQPSRLELFKRLEDSVGSIGGLRRK